MIDFNKKIINSDKFRGPALLFIKTGLYCPHPKGTAEYMRFWSEEKEKCIDGYTSDDGDFISGYNYFYLNYCPINRNVNRIVNGKVKTTLEVTFPDFWDYDYYYFQCIEEALEQGKHLCVLKSRRKGYELPYSEDVLTPTGFKQMGSLHVGDYVMNPNGQPVRIADIVELGIQEIYEVEFQDGRVVRCGANHLWATCRNGKKFYIMPTKEYAKRKLIQGSKGKEHYPYKVPELNPLKFDELPISVDPYVLGVLLGDGYICGSLVLFTTDDLFIVEELSRRLPDYTIKKDQLAEFKYTIISNKKGCNTLNRQLKELGVKVKAYDKFIPENYKFSSVENRFELVRGLMDTDGSITKGAATFVSTSEKLIDDLVFVLRSLGIRVHKSKKIEGRIGVEFINGHKSNTLPHWELCITTQQDIFKLPRKLERIRKDRKYNYNGIGIKAIRATGKFEKQRCLCIDNENHLYITRDFIPTHNSYKAGSMLCRNYYLIPNSKSYVYASNKQYLTDDGVLTKAWDYMDFIDEYTAWGKKRSVNTQMRRRAGVWTKDEYGNLIELGYKSEIIGVTLKDNPDVVRGKKANLILFEEAGSFKELSAAWQIARPSVEVDGVAFGTMIAYGTGGDEESNFFTLKDMFYHPDGYNCLPLLNIWDEHVQGTLCGFFIPLYANMDIRDEAGNRLYMDDDGNTITSKACAYILEERRKVVENSTNSVAVDRYVAERPIMPAEACLEFNGNIFPKKELQELLSKIRINKHLRNAKQVGDLVWQSDGSLKWVLKKTGDITKYPLGKDDDPTGSIVIWEHPVKDAPIGLYILGVDPYDHDLSGTNSLGSTFVYKRFLGFEQYYDIIVAEYTGRPKSAEDYYENLRKLAVYYNGRIMYENERKGLFPYFTAKHCDYLLADQPDIINDIIANSTVLRRKGCHMNKLIKQWGEGLIKDWLNEEKSPGHKNLHDILSEPLLEELISYNDTGNFDRCLTKDTNITTKYGIKLVLDIKIGDEVLTDKGRFKKVIWTDKHVHNGFKANVKLMGDYRILLCTENHPILVAFTDKKTHRFRKQALENILYLRADLLKYKYQFGFIPKRKLIEKIDLSDDILYLLGWIMADGYIGTKSNVIRITYQTNQLNCAKKCADIIESYLSNEKYYFSKQGRKIERKPCKIYQYKQCWRLEVNSKQLHELCYWFGCRPNNKVINYNIYNKYNNLMPFVIGWLEGDGHQNLNVNYDGYTRNNIELSTIYEELIQQCRQIMIDNGIYSSIRKIQSNKYKTLYSIQFSNEFVNRVLSFYPSLKFLKIDIIKNTCKNLETEDGFWVPIQLLSLEKMNDIVYNFEVECDHTYIAEGITTHNCMALMQVMIYRELLYNLKVKEKKKENKKRVLFEGPLFTSSWFNDDLLPSFVEDNVYTFTN